MFYKLRSWDASLISNASCRSRFSTDFTCQHSLPKTGPSYRQQQTVAMHKRDVRCFWTFSITKPSSYMIQQTETKMSQSSNGFKTVAIPVDFLVGKLWLGTKLDCLMMRSLPWQGIANPMVAQLRRKQVPEVQKLLPPILHGIKGFPDSVQLFRRRTFAILRRLENNWANDDGLAGLC